MLSDQQRMEAATALRRARETRVQTPGPSRAWPEITLGDAYAIAALGIEERIAAGARLMGRKVGLTSKAMQRSSRIDEPDFGSLLDEMFHPDGARIPAVDYCVPRVEMELAFVMGSDLAGRDVTLEEALDATDHIVPSLELIDARAEDPRSIFDTVADNGAAAGVIMGSTRIRPSDTDLRWIGGILLLNDEVEETGLAAAVLGHPANPLIWLAAKLAEFGLRIEAGHVILTGAFARPVWVGPGDEVVADFGALGAVSAEFT